MFSRIKYTLRETGTGFRRNLTLTAAAILTSAVSLVLVGLTFLLQKGFDNQLSQWEGGVEMIVYVNNDATPEQIELIRSSLASSSVVDASKLQFLDAEQSLAEAQRILAGSPQAARQITIDTVPLEFKVVPATEDLDLLREAAATFQTLPGVRSDGVIFPADDIEVIAHVKSFVGVWSAILSVSLLIAAVLLIWNTIRTAIFARRQEIEVMKLVGATNWFIRIPFMLEGLLQGLIGGAFACLGVYFINERWTAGVHRFPQQSGLLALVVDGGYRNTVMLGIIALGALVGAIGAGIASSRFLDV